MSEVERACGPHEEVCVDKTMERDYLQESQAILAGRSMLLPQREHLEALAKLIPFWPEPVRKVEFHVAGAVIEFGTVREPRR